MKPTTLMNFDSRSALEWLAGDEERLTNEEIAKKLRCHGYPVDQSTISRFKNKGWAEGKDIAGLDSLVTHDLFQTTSRIAIAAQEWERILRKARAEYTDEEFRDILDVAAEKCIELRRNMKILNTQKYKDDEHDYALDYAAINSLEGHIARYDGDYDAAFRRFMKVRHSVSIEDLEGLEGAQILCVRAEVNAFDAAYRADGIAGPIHPYIGRTSEVLDILTSESSVQRALKFAARLKDPRILYNVAEGLLFRGLAAPRHATMQNSRRSLINRAGQMLLAAWRVDPSPNRAPSVDAWELPNFGRPYAEPHWAAALDVVVQPSSQEE